MHKIDSVGKISDMGEGTQGERQGENDKDDRDAWIFSILKNTSQYNLIPKNTQITISYSLVIISRYHVCFCFGWF